MSKSLQLIGGVVSGLTVHAGEEEFVRSVGQQTTGVGVAAGLALEGMAGAAAGTGLAASSAGDSVEFVTCKIGEQSVQGRFSKITFKDGDVLDMVISPQRNSLPLVLATRRSSDRVLWMAPHCSRGTSAHKSFALRLFGWLVLGMPLFFIIPSFAIIYISDIPMDFDGVLFHGAICLARQAEQIFAALGYPDPSRVDLPRDHKRYCKSKGIGWPYTVNKGVDAGPWTYHYLESQGSRATQ